MLNLTPLKQASQTLIDTIDLYHEKIDDNRLALALRDSVIQRFEYTYELAWKAIQRWISNNVNPESAEPVYSRKELYRLAARRGLIRDPKPWFSYHEARNISAHTYDEARALQVFNAAVEMVDDVNYLIIQLEKYRD